MTDIPVTPEVLAEFSKLTPEQQAVADRAYGGALGRAKGNSATVVHTLTPALTQNHMDTGKSVLLRNDDGLSREQVVAGTAALAKFNPDAALAFAEQNGIRPSEIGLGDDQTAAGANADPPIPGLEPPSDPSGYDLRPPSVMADGEIGDVANVLDAMRSGFFEAGVPKVMAQSLATALIEGASRQPELESDEAKQLRYAEQGAMVRRVAGGDASEIVRLHELGFSALPEYLQTMLSDAWALHDAEAYIALANFGRIVEARRSRK